MATRKPNLPHDRSAEPRITVAAAAKRMNCSTSYIYKLVAEGQLNALRIGTRRGLRVSARSIEKFLAAKALEG